MFNRVQGQAAGEARRRVAQMLRHVAVGDLVNHHREQQNNKLKNQKRHLFNSSRKNPEML